MENEYQCHVNFFRNCTKFYVPGKCELTDNDIVCTINIFLRHLTHYLVTKNLKNIKLVVLGCTFNFEFYITPDEYNLLLENIEELVTDETSDKNNPKVFKCLSSITSFRDFKYLLENSDRLCNKPKRDDIFIYHSISTSQSMRIFFNDIHVPIELSIEEFYEKMSEHKYVLCPTSAGMFTTRLVESIVCGCIPITKLPTGFVDDRFNNCSIINLPGVCEVCKSDRITTTTQSCKFIQRVNIKNSIDILKMPERWKNYKIDTEQALKIFRDTFDPYSSEINASLSVCN